MSVSNSDSVSSASQRRKSVLFLTQFSILVAIQALFCFVPILGSIPIPFTPMVATTAMIPVIMTAIFLGTAAGTIMGAIAGMFSLVIWTFITPASPLAFLYNPMVTTSALTTFFALFNNIVPRVLIGVFAGCFFNSLKRAINGKRVAEIIVYAVTGIIGSLTNTVITIAVWYLVFADEIVAQLGIARDVLFDGVVVVTFVGNGIPELALSAFIAAAVCLPLRKILLKQKMITE
ncbi:membrane protein [Clostridia bacterium]|nr:membrane protein [Clostridia bacterium]